MIIVKKILVFVIASILSIESAYALHLEVFGAAGYGKSKVETETKSPNIGAYQLGGTVGYDFFPLFYVGVTGGVESIIQFSDTTNSYGNRKGTRSDLSPTLGFVFLGLHAKYEYKLWGDYKLSKKNSTNQEITYKSPSGHRFSLQVPVFPMIKLGVYFETIQFDEIDQGGTESALTKPLTLSHYGLVMSVIF